MVAIAVVDQNADLLGADLLRSKPKDKQHGVDDIGLATAIGAYNG